MSLLQNIVDINGKPILSGGAVDLDLIYDFECNNYNEHMLECVCISSL